MKRLFGMAIVAIAILGIHPLTASANCASKLVGTSWNCAWACNDSSSGTNCIEFGHYGLSTDFDAYITAYSSNEGCTCQSSGSPSKPKFESSKNSFICSEQDYSSSELGKITGKKLFLQYSDYLGYACVETCRKNSASTCS
jgi:hypothetical protein